MFAGGRDVFHGLCRQPQVCRRAEQRPRRPDPQVALPHVPAVGSHGIDEVNAVVDDQGHVRAVQNRHDLTAQADQLVVRGVRIAQLYYGGPGAHGR